VVNKKIIKFITTNFLALILIFLFAFPIYWMIIDSFMPNDLIIKWPPIFIPNKLTLNNYLQIINGTPIIRWFLNSIFVSVAVATLSVLIDIFAAYALARMNFKGRDMIFKIILGALSIPGIILFLPNYVTVNFFGWTNTYLAIILPALAGTFGVFLLRQFFIGIPRELEEAAKIDGAGFFSIVFKIIVPEAWPAIITLFVMNFMGTWNDYFWPLIVLNSKSMYTLPVGMSAIQSQYIQWYGTMMAGAFMIALPSIVVFIIVQRYYIKGIVFTGVKG